MSISRDEELEELARELMNVWPYLSSFQRWRLLLLVRWLSLKHALNELYARRAGKALVLLMALTLVSLVYMAVLSN